LVSVAVIGVAIGSCSLNGHTVSDAEALVRQFTDKLQQREVADAAKLTTYPDEASSTMSQVFSGLDPGTSKYQLTQFITLGPTDAFFTMNVSWHFGAGEDWAYQVQGKAEKLAPGWRVSWDPQLLVPGLGESRTVKLLPAYGPPSQVLDIHGAPLMTEQAVNVVTLDPSHTGNAAASAAAVANAIAPIAPAITQQSLLSDLRAARGKPITTVVLRDGDYGMLTAPLTAIPGVAVTKQRRLLTADRELDSPLLDALRGVWQHSRDASAGWAVQTFDPSGAPAGNPLTGYVPPAGPTVKSTLDRGMQLAAENAAALSGTPTSVVVMQAKTGAVLAAAQESYPDAVGSADFTGLYSAGDMLDLFAGGTAAAKKMRDRDVDTADLLNTVARLGIGSDVKVPGLSTITGEVPGMHHHVETIGMMGNPDTGSHSAGVLVSPFGMALAAATIAHGAMPMPMIDFWQPASLATPVGPLSAAVLARLRQLMTEHPAPGVTGHTANAGDDQWFIGYRGDLAFAVHVSNAPGDDTAAAVAGRLFSGDGH
jgi:hypothetical protein